LKFKEILIEESLWGNPLYRNRVKKILEHPIFLQTPFHFIPNYRLVFDALYRPYLLKQKEKTLRLILAQKKGMVVKEAPENYGAVKEEGVVAPHFYITNGLNCVYECEYCFLQGHFSNPDLVLFLNYEEMRDQLESKTRPYGHRAWCHLGEYTDSLALSHLTEEIFFWHETAKQYPKIEWELRTKSANVSSLLSLPPLENFFCTFSLSPESAIKIYDRKTPSLKSRLGAIKKLLHHGHKVGIHFDPVIWSPNWKKEYEELFYSLFNLGPPEKFSYFSLGVVRFTQKDFDKTHQHYPDSSLFAMEFVSCEDGKKKYPYFLRREMLSFLSNCLENLGVNSSQWYVSMEEEVLLKKNNEVANVFI